MTLRARAGEKASPDREGVSGGGSGRTNQEAELLCAKLFARWPLPKPDGDGDKENRGTVLVVGGAPQMPGAVILAATAVLRAGAGKLQIATCRSIAPLVAAEVPEAYVASLPEGKDGAILSSAAKSILHCAASASAVLLGPGMVGEKSLERWIPSLLSELGKTKATLVLDAAPLAVLPRHPECLRPFSGRVAITPHAGEMARITGIRKSDVVRGAEAIARATSKKMGAIVALKGAVTFVAAPSGATYRNEAGNEGLGTSGSGDTLAGIIAGLVSRGADPLQATAWGVHVHACAGDRLANQKGATLGFLARELLAEIPVVMSTLERQGRRRH